MTTSGLQHGPGGVETDGLEQRPQHGRVEVHAVRAQQHLEALERCARPRVIGAVRRDRVETVGHRDDAGQRGLPPFRARVGVAGAVVVHVVLEARPHGVDHDLRQAGHARHHLRALDRVAADLDPLLGIERAGLAKHVTVDRHLADVVQQAGDTEVRERLARQPQRLPHADRQHRDVDAVRIGVFIVVLERRQSDERVLVLEDAVDDRLHDTLGVPQVGAAVLAGTQHDLARADHGAPEHLTRARALGLLLRKPVEFACEVLGVQMGRGQRHDVVDRRRVRGLGQLGRQGRVLGGQEDLEETLELGFGHALQEAQPAGLSLVEVREQCLIGTHERGARLDAHAVQVEVVRHRDKCDLVLVVEQSAQHLHEVLQLALERHVRDVVRARRAQQRHQPLDQRAAGLRQGLGLVAIIVRSVTHAALLDCSAASHACRTGARRDCAPASSAASALGVPMRARQRAMA